MNYSHRRLRLLLLLAILPLAAIATLLWHHSRPNPTEAELSRLRGAWSSDEDWTGGLYAGTWSRPVLCIDNNQAYFLDQAGRPIETERYNLLLNPALHQIDFIQPTPGKPPRTNSGIYALTGDNLQICLSPAGASRPTSLDRTPPGAILMQFVRSNFSLEDLFSNPTLHSKTIDKAGVQFTACLPSTVRRGDPVHLSVTFRNSRDEDIHVWTRKWDPEPFELFVGRLDRGGVRRQRAADRAWPMERSGPIYPRAVGPQMQDHRDYDLSSYFALNRPGIYVVRVACGEIDAVDADNKEIPAALSLCFTIPPNDPPESPHKRLLP